MPELDEHFQKLDTSAFTAFPADLTMAYAEAKVTHLVSSRMIPGRRKDIQHIIWKGGKLRLSGVLVEQTNLFAGMVAKHSLAIGGLTLYNVHLASFALASKQIAQGAAAVSATIEFSFTGYSR